MKKFCNILLGMFVAAFACPESWCSGAVEVQSKYSFDNLLDAIKQVESGGNPKAVGDGGEAVGTYQIHEIYVDDVNRILRYPRFSYADRKDPYKSRLMTSVYIRHYGKGKSIEAMARIHNGGPKGHKKKSTLQYWQKVKKVLEK